MFRWLMLTGALSLLVCPLSAGTVSCQSGADIASLSSAACATYSSLFSNSLFTVSDYIDWGDPVSATGQSGLGDALTANTHEAGDGEWMSRTAGGIDVGLALRGSAADTLLKRIDNTKYAWGYYAAWDENWWIAPPTGVETYAGHFNAPSTPTSTPVYGEHLVGTRQGAGYFELSFSEAMEGVGLRVSSGASNFMATMEAYDESGLLLGVSQLSAQGLGGTCAGLSTGVRVVPYNNPVPCNDAPFLAFARADAAIRTIRIYTDKPDDVALLAGLAMDRTADDPVPEPHLFLMTGGGLAVVALLRRRRASRA